MTDPLLSSNSFRVIHDGAGFSRSEKVKFLSECTVSMKNLRVCWEGKLKGNNCGECEKCVRTRLNFVIAGSPNPECFDTPLTKKHFKPIKLRTNPARTEWNLIRTDIKRTGNGIEWLPEVEKVIKKKPKQKLRSRIFIKNLFKRLFKITKSHS